MSLGDLYSTAVLRLAADAAGARRLPAPDVTVERVNPICGDRILVDLGRSGDRISDLGYEVRACVLCQASASVLGAHAVGRSRAELSALLATVRAMLEANGAAPAGPFGDYAALAPVAAHRSRHTCVLLPVEAVLEALEAE